MTDKPQLNPNDFIITRKRKLYKFAVFQNLANCYDYRSWPDAKEEILHGSAKPLTVEIGAGSALFLTKLAQLHPERQFIAIDRKSDRLQHGAKIADADHLDNIVYLWSNAHNLGSLLPAGSVDELWITFPDPWPQESNIKHRLTNQKFLAQYHQLLKSGGSLNFKTDNTSLFDWSVEQFAPQLWAIQHVTNDLHNDPSVNADSKIMTTYEERYAKEGKHINYLLAKAV